MQPINIEHKGYLITTDKTLMLIDDVYKWLSEESYWCKGIPFDVFQQAFEHSYCIGALINGHQVAFARLVTDYATFGYLADVYVAEEHRKKGISKIMIEVLFNQEWVLRLRRIMLATKDAHNLYHKVGFTECRFPERIMELTRPHIYEEQKSK